MVEGHEIPYLSTSIFRGGFRLRLRIRGYMPVGELVKPILGCRYVQYV